MRFKVGDRVRFKGDEMEYCKDFFHGVREHTVRSVVGCLLVLGETGVAFAHEKRVELVGDTAVSEGAVPKGTTHYATGEFAEDCVVSIWHKKEGDVWKFYCPQARRWIKTELTEKEVRDMVAIPSSTQRFVVGECCTVRDIRHNLEVDIKVTVVTEQGVCFTTVECGKESYLRFEDIVKVEHSELQSTLLKKWKGRGLDYAWDTPQSSTTLGEVFEFIEEYFKVEEL